ncbi:MAG: cupin domain-containing protein [Phototrophicaceae bacterium]|jgi:quercetin dioxygenase-like cupin family protein
MTDGYFITTDDVQGVETFPNIIRRTLGVTDEVMLCEFHFQAGAVVPEHSHMNDQVGYVIRGRMEFRIGDEVRILGPGGSYAIPGGVPHSATILEECLAVDAFSPPRSDYLTEAK